VNLTTIERDLKTRRRRASAVERAEWVRRFRQSGLSQEAFAQKYGLKVSSLRNWLYKRSAPPKAPRLIELPNPLSIPAPDASEAEVLLRSGHRVRLRGAAAGALVQWLSRALR
jgi:transcriptional regulator with XRE-family HTH domain